MRVVELLRAVRDGQSVPPADLQAFIFGVARRDIPDYQASAFLMAVYQRGLSDSLTAAMTLAMRDSGKVINLRDIPGTKVDKHSTGGVGDKISLPLAPLVAACGVPVPMVSGRSLGHTGGTLDKLESIPGFRVDLEVDTFRHLVRDLGLCLMGQTADLAPADKILYALRDVTATVESVPLITASILSKKLAEGIDALLLDVKVGRGAFMKDLPSAQRLAESLVRVGQSAGVRVRALLTRMQAPLGRTIGNALEVREAVEILHGRGPKDTTELTLALAAEMLVLGGVAKDRAAAMPVLQRAIQSGAAAQKFKALIAAQEGNASVVDDLSLLPKAQHVTDVLSTASGYITDMDSFVMGLVAMRLGAGRARAEDKVDAAVGLELTGVLGDYVERDTPLIRVHHNRPLADTEVDILRNAVTLAPAPGAVVPLILGELG